MKTSGGRKRQHNSAYGFGLRAEQLAALYLRLKGYRILRTRYRVPVGEIDIIARTGGAYIFVEVKGRKILSDALQALRHGQKQRIVRAAEFWLAENDLSLGADCRFDIIVFSAYLVPHHITNAFTTDGTQRMR